MYSNRWIQSARIGYVIMSVFLCILGCVLIAVPGFSASLLCQIIGGLLILFGFVKIIGYCSKDLYRLAFQYDLASGLLLMILGVVFVFRAGLVMNAIFILLGFYVLGDALLKIQIAMDSRAFGIRQWWLILTAALLTGILGFLLILRPSASAQIVMVMLGVTLVTEGILNLITILVAVKIRKDV